MERPRRQRDISLSIHSFSLTAAPSGSYGLKLSGKAPAMVAQVQKGSPAARAGLQVGDFVLRVAGQELRSADGERVLRRLKEEVGKTVEVMVARPFPVPVTDKEKMKALIVLQTKLDSGTIFQPADSNYSSAVQGALAATKDILGDLGLDQPLTSSGSAQEVEVKMYDSDSLPSPPPSSDSEEEKDPLLDFTRDDGLTYRPGQSQAAQSLAESVRQATQALEGLKDLTEGVKKREKPKPQLVSSEASLVTGGAGKRRSKSKSPPGDELQGDNGRDTEEPTPFDDVSGELQWVEPVHLAPPPLPPLESPDPSQQLNPSQPAERDVPPPVPPHGRAVREPWSEGGQRRREREDTRREIARELARREKAEEKAKEQSSKVVPSRKAPVAAQPRAAGHVPLRIKRSKEKPAGIEEDSQVVGKPAGYKKLHPPPSHPAPSPPSNEPVSDMADQQTALQGLPPSIVTWRGEEVATWLLQLSPTLSQHYRPCFSQHDITGQTLMRLNLAKLKSIGIDNIKHCQQLALEIAKLKIYQESLELKELEVENQLSFL